MDSSEPASNLPIPLDLLDAGDPRFVAALRALADSAALARFAAAWSADQRPEARRLLFAYLAEPPNAPGHEGLIKRLFKLAEAAGDDEVMARFLVLADRLVARGRSTRYPWGSERFATLEEARAQGLEWIAQGWGDVRWGKDPESRGGDARPYQATGRYQATTGSPRNTTLPRPDWKGGAALASLTDDERGRRRWFSVATRRHLQRRVWRYFRHLGETGPPRYIAAATTALGLYHPAELADGYALLDHFGLLHLLFDQSPALVLGSAGWDLGPGRTLVELAPAPAFEEAWHDHPAAVLRVLTTAQAPIIARWAARRVEADPDRFRPLGTAATWVDLLDRPDPEVVALALALLETPAPAGEPVAREVTPARWVGAAEAAAPWNQARICAWIGRTVPADAVPRAAAVRLALSPAEPLARLGWHWIEGQGVATVPAGDDPDDDARALLRLVDAGFEPLRPTILEALRAGLADRAGGQAAWVGALLASRHRDARAVGWAWFESTRSLRDDPALWARLVASPDPDIQAACATVAGPVPVAPAVLGEVWAAVLLRPAGVARLKPAVIRRVVAWLDALPASFAAEAAAGVDLLAAVVRSARGPERHAALAALVALAERRPAWAGPIEAAVPALQFAERPAILPA